MHSRQSDESHGDAQPSPLKERGDTQPTLRSERGEGQADSAARRRCATIHAVTGEKGGMRRSLRR
jgi:hypothetical protein